MQLRLKFPEHVSLRSATTFASVLFCVQILEGTHTEFSLMFFAFTLLSVVAFNTAGGFSRIAGAYVFFFSVLVIGLGVVWKAVLGQAGDSYVEQPQLGITLYTASMFMLLLVVIGLRKFDPRAHSVATMLRADRLNLTRVALGCLIVAVALQVATATLPVPAGLASIVLQLNLLLPLSIILGTIGAIKDSGGKRGFSLVNSSAMLFAFAGGCIAFSKQGMLTPPVCWLVGACYMRLRLRTLHLVGLAAFAFFALYMASPLSTLRDDVGDDFTIADRAYLFYDGVVHFGRLKAEVAATSQDRAEREGASDYFNTSQGGMLERLTMFPVDDGLFSYTAEGHYVGYHTILLDFENWIPHFLLPDKELGFNGNYYAHELGGLPVEDTTTGISFSPVAEAFHVGGWLAVFLLMPGIWVLLFESMEFVTGDLRTSPWGLFVIVHFAHSAPESLLSGLIYEIFNVNVALVAMMVFCVKIAPVLALLLKSPKEFVLQAPVHAISRSRLQTR